MKNDKTVKIGVIGLGHRGIFLLKTVLNVSNVEVPAIISIGIASRSPSESNLVFTKLPGVTEVIEIVAKPTARGNGTVWSVSSASGTITNQPPSKGIRAKSSSSPLNVE